MQKKTRTIGFILLVTATLHAPLFAVDWGFTSGVYRSGLNLKSSDIPLPMEPRLSFRPGLFVELPLGRFSLRPEVGLTVRGVDYISERGALAWTSVHRIHYVDFEVLTTFALPVKLRPTPFVLLGPYYSRELGSDLINVYDDGTSFMIDYQDDLENAVRDWDFGLVVGAGVVFDVCIVQISMEARGYFGLTDILTDMEAYNAKFELPGVIEEDQSLRTRGVLLSLGIGL